MSDAVITMLGASGAGKTCFMLGLYNTMRDEMPNGFTLSTDLDDDLELERLWNRMISARGADRWPPPTSDQVPKPYRFQLNYSCEPIVGFDWKDYRGGALREASSQADVRDLVDRLKKSDCIMLCVSGELFRGSRTRPQISREAGIGRMIDFLTAVRASVGAGSLPAIIVVVTKYDRCDRPMSAVREDLLELFRPLFAPNSGWLVALSGVTLGLALNEDRDNGILEPDEMHLPFAFAMYHFLQSKNSELGERVEAQKRVISSLSQTGFARWWNRRELDVTQSAAKLSSDSLNEIGKNMSLLVQQLRAKELPIYFSGRRVELASK